LTIIVVVIVTVIVVDNHRFPFSCYFSWTNGATHHSGFKFHPATPRYIIIIIIM